jgi:hypothetical protein
MKAFLKAIYLFEKEKILIFREKYYVMEIKIIEE